MKTVNCLHTAVLVNIKYRSNCWTSYVGHTLEIWRTNVQYIRNIVGRKSVKIIQFSISKEVTVSYVISYLSYFIGLKLNNFRRYLL